MPHMPSLGWAHFLAHLSRPTDRSPNRVDLGESDRSSWMIIPSGQDSATPGDTAKDTGDARVNSWAAPGTGSDTGAPAGPDARRRGRDWQVVSASTTSLAVAASAIRGISDTGVET
jgi:hypothetical protein